MSSCSGDWWRMYHMVWRTVRFVDQVRSYVWVQAKRPRDERSEQAPLHKWAPPPFTTERFTTERETAIWSRSAVLLPLGAIGAIALSGRAHNHEQL